MRWIALAMVTGCPGGGDGIAGSWDLLDVQPIGASTSATDSITGCMEVEPDFSGAISVLFLAGTINASTFTGAEVSEQTYAFDLDTGEAMECTVAGDDLDCELGMAGADPLSRLTLARGVCTVATPTTPPPGPAAGNWGGHCTGTAGGTAIDHDVLMHLVETGGALTGDFEFHNLPTCTYSALFTVEGSRTDDQVQVDFVDRSTLTTYPCGSPIAFAPVSLDGVLDGEALAGDLTTDDGVLTCTFDRF